MVFEESKCNGDVGTEVAGDVYGSVDDGAGKQSPNDSAGTRGRLESEHDTNLDAV